jgi:RNA polymerase sigma-B factor
VAPAGASEAAAAVADSESPLDAVDDLLSLSEAMRRLPARERTILRLRFDDGLTQTEIAERVGLSQMYVSRLLRASLETLRHEID